MASVQAPPSVEYAERNAASERDARILALSRKSVMTPGEKDEALRLLLSDYAARAVVATTSEDLS